MADLDDTCLIRCSTAWREMADAAAERAGQSTSAWLRDLAERAAEAPLPVPPPGRAGLIERLRAAIESLHGETRDDLVDAVEAIGAVHGALIVELVRQARED